MNEPIRYNPDDPFNQENFDPFSDKDEIDFICDQEEVNDNWDGYDEIPSKGRSAQNHLETDLDEWLDSKVL